MIGTIMLYLLGGVFIIFVLSGIRIVRPTERGLVERLGKYLKIMRNNY